MAPSSWHRRQQCLLRRLRGAGPRPSHIWHCCINASRHEIGKGSCKVSCTAFATVHCFQSRVRSWLPHTLKPSKHISTW